MFFTFYWHPWFLLPLFSMPPMLFICFKASNDPQINLTTYSLRAQVCSRVPNSRYWHHEQLRKYVTFLLAKIPYFSLLCVSFRKSFCCCLRCFFVSNILLHLKWKRAPLGTRKMRRSSAEAEEEADLMLRSPFYPTTHRIRLLEIWVVFLPEEVWTHISHMNARVYWGGALSSFWLRLPPT